jgi:glucosamine--fructose-6-phosphate aminotransferase (isomerizing)
MVIPLELFRGPLIDVGGSPHYMIKEIHEEPSILKKLWENLGGRVFQAAQRIYSSDKIYIVGSGSSYNAGLVFHYALAHHAKRISNPITSGEYMYYSKTISKGDVVIAISQSGYTSDTLEASRGARDAGAFIVGVTNGPESPLARISDYVIYIMAGKEEAVTATKTFTAQIYALLMIVSEVSKQGGGEGIEDLGVVPRTLLSSISLLEPISRRIASDIYRYGSAFTLGEGVGYAIAREAALKLKEAAGVHAEAIQTSEARHGPKTIMGKKTPIYCNVFFEEDLDHVAKLQKDLEGSGAPIYLVTSIDVDDNMRSRSFDAVSIPPLRSASISIIAAAFYQLLSYYISISRLLDPDMPRMLSKVVT